MNKIKRGATVWAVAGTLLLAWFSFAAGVNSANKDDATEKIEQQLRLEHFYRVVGGELSGQESGPANKLARDLRDLETEDLGAFVGDSNRYGGISEDLGFDPFNGVDCSECGPLDGEIIAGVEEIKNGNLTAVIVELESEVVLDEPMADPPGFLWLLWIISLPAGIGFLYIRQKREEESKYRDYAGERALVHSLREVARELPDAERWKTAHLADQLEAQIEMRVNYTESKVQEMKLNDLIQEASSTLEAISAGNRELT